MHLTEMGKSDVWNLIVDMGNSSNFAERYEALVGFLQPHSWATRDFQAGIVDHFKPWFWESEIPFVVYALLGTK